MNEVDERDFATLFIESIPLLDVRSEPEFAKGAFPAAVNLPILTDAERKQVGLCYQHEGQAAAIALGHQLVSGDARQSRVAAWCALADENPELVLYCWRGGLRSELAQQWLAESGRDVARVKGGYKALRNYLRQVIETHFPKTTLIRIGGRTGCGKTALLHSIGHGIDLERAANHRGSSFGRMPEPQRTQVDFENRIAIELMQCLHLRPGYPLLVEDEGRRIGAASIPEALYLRMRDSSLVVVEMSQDIRIDNVLNDYVIGMRLAYEDLDPQQGFESFSRYLLESLQRIRRRLGGANYERARDLMVRALEQQKTHGQVELHCQWIELLLSSYYDRMYDYQLSRQAEQIAFRGEWPEVKEWLETRLLRRID